MGTPFITLLEPTKLDGYNPNLPHNMQAPHIPAPFKDAMEVRERVFVTEQGCPLEFEHDADDARSCHWIMYASVNTTTEPEERDPHTLDVVRPRRSITQTVPIGTLRIVPFPHPPHPPDGARYVGGVLQPAEDGFGASHPEQNGNGKLEESGSPNGNSNGNGTAQRRHRGMSLVDHDRMSAPMPYGADRQTDFHDGKESYVKLGRVAVLPEYRGRGIADQLWNAARQWLEQNPAFFNPSVKEWGMDVMKVDNTRDVPEWNGLVCVHAQEAVTKIYERWGFRLDKGMGKFYEENIPHVGMWTRLKIRIYEPTVYMSGHR
ncbi:acetyltransferase [Xylaria curta]|nr:acetyltransferase [Xylaria curta]